MARAMGRLTALKVEKEKKPGMYADGGGLYLRVTPEGAKNWVLRYMLNRKPHWMGLGPVALYGLQEARERALVARRQTLSRRGALSGHGNAWTGRNRSRSSTALKATSPHTALGGATTSTQRNGEEHFPPMLIRSSACCRWMQ